MDERYPDSLSHIGRKWRLGVSENCGDGAPMSGFGRVAVHTIS